MQRHLIHCGLICALGLLPGVVFAQAGGNRSGNSGTSINFGTSGFGNSMGGGTSSTSFQTNAFGGSGGMGTGGMGTGGMGTGGMGQGLGQGGIGLQGMGGQQGGNFIGSNANQNQFLGRNVQGQQGGMGMNAMNQFGGNRGGGRNNANNINTMNSMFGGANNANSHPVIRPRQKVAFDYPVPKGDALQTKLQNHLVKVSLRNPTLSNVMLTTNGGGEIVMRGAVSTEAQARLAENLLRLEPGVRTIRNELTFPPAKTDAE